MRSSPSFGAHLGESSPNSTQDKIEVCDNAFKNISILTTKLSWLSKISQYL